MSGCRATTQCRTNLRYTNLLGEQRLNQSAPSVYSSVWIGKKTCGRGLQLEASLFLIHPSFSHHPIIYHPSIIHLSSVHCSSIHHPSTLHFFWINHVSFLVGDNIIELDRDASSSPGSRRWTTSRPCLPCCSNLDDCFHPGLPSGLRSQSPRIHTAPPSPMRPHRVLEEDSLDELRTSVQLAASSMESSTKDIRLLGEKMAAATERMTETVQDNSQALVLLTEVVDRLQKLLVATRTESGSLKPPDADAYVPQQPRCSCTSSFSSTSSLEAPSTSQAAARLSGLGPGSARASLQQKEQEHADANASRHLLTNGVQNQPEEPKAAKGGCQNQRKKKRKKAT